MALRRQPTRRQQLPPKTGRQHEQEGAHDGADGDATQQQQHPDENDLHKLRDEVDDDKESGRAHDWARIITTVLAGFEDQEACPWDAVLRRRVRDAFACGDKQEGRALVGQRVVDRQGGVTARRLEAQR